MFGAIQDVGVGLGEHKSGLGELIPPHPRGPGPPNDT